MEYWTLMNFLQEMAGQNEEAHNAIKKLADLLKINQKLRREEQACIEEKYRQEMELETQLSMAKMLEEERTQRDVMAEQLKVAHVSSMEMQEQVRKIDLKKLGYYEMLVNELQHQQEWKEMEEVMRQKQEMCQQMENRQIVQQLRCKQNELHVALARSKEGKEFVQRSYAEALKKLEAANEQRNRLTVSMVEGSKKLDSLRKEIYTITNQQRELPRLQETKAELKARLEKLKNLQKQPQSHLISNPSLSADDTIFKRPQAPQNTLQINNNNSNWKNLIPPPAIDPFNPMAFLKTLDIKFEIGSAITLANISPAVEQDTKKKKEENSTVAQLSELRPILKGSEAATGPNKQDQQDKMRHVRFAEPDSSSNCTSPSCPSPVNSLDADENLCLAKVIKVFDKKTESFKRDDTEETKERLVKEEVSNLLTRGPETSSNNSLPMSRPVAGEGKQQPEAAIDILECRIIKPAGSVLPITLSENIPLSSTSTFDVLSASEKESIPTPTPPPTFKTPGNIVTKNTATAIRQALDDYLKNPSAETSSHPSTSKSSFNELPKKAQSKKILDFDSMFLFNTSPQSEEDDLNTAPMPKINAMVGLENKDSLESDEGDVMMFSDNDWLHAGPGTNEDFF